MDIARLRASDLGSETSFIIERWKSLLDADTRNNLSQARRHLDKLGTRLAVRLDPRQRHHVSEACRRVSDIYNEEYGKATRKADEIEP